MFFAFFYSGFKATPFVFYPYGTEILGFFAEYDHDFCGFYGVVNVRFVLFGDLIAQAYSAEEYFTSFG